MNYMALETIEKKTHPIVEKIVITRKIIHSKLIVLSLSYAFNVSEILVEG